MRSRGQVAHVRLLGLTALSLWTFGCTSNVAPFGSPTIFVGSLQAERFLPLEAGSCRSDPGNESLAVGAGGRVCVSNACGDGEAEFRVERVLAGISIRQRGVLRYSLGEWCQPRFGRVEGPVLVCVYDGRDGQHRFRAEPVYAIDDGPAILLQELRQIGDIELASLLKRLPSSIHVGNVSEFEPHHVEELVALGIVIVENQDVIAVRGVFLRELAEALADGHWQPRKVATLVRDGLGGFVEVADSELEGRIELWDC